MLQLLHHLSRLLPSVLAEAVSTTEHFTEMHYSLGNPQTSVEAMSL